MFDSEFEKKCKETLNNVIELAENICQKKVKKSFYHVINNKENETEYDYILSEKTLHNITNIYTFINSLEANKNENIPRNTIIILKLNSYLHCVESRYTYKVIGNIFRTINQKSVKGSLFDGSNSGIQCFNNLVDNIADKDKDQINKLCKIWDSFINRNLRNAISHNDYVISEKDVIIPSNTRKQIENKTITKKQDIYTVEEINDMYKKANEFQKTFKSFAQKYGKALGPRY